MPIEIETPDGIAEFPNEMQPDEIQSVLQKHYSYNPRQLQVPEEVRQGLNAVGRAVNLADTATHMTDVGIQAADIPDSNAPPPGPSTDLAFLGGQSMAAPPKPRGLTGRLLLKSESYNEDYAKSTQGLPQVERKMADDLYAVHAMLGKPPPTEEEIHDTIQSDPYNESVLGISPDVINYGHGPVSGWLTAAGKGTAGLSQFLTSPNGITQQMAALTPAKLLITAKWFYDMMKGGVQSTGKLKELLEKPNKTEEDFQSIRQETVNALMNFGGVGVLGKHTLKADISTPFSDRTGPEPLMSREAPTLPMSRNAPSPMLRALENTPIRLAPAPASPLNLPPPASRPKPPTTGEPNASQIESTTPPNGSMRTRSELGQLPEGNVEAADARLRVNTGEKPAEPLPAQESGNRATEAIADTASKLGLTVDTPKSKASGGMLIEGLTDAERGELEKLQSLNQTQLTDKSPDSPFTGMTLHVSESATPTEVQAILRHKRALEMVPALKIGENKIIPGKPGGEHGDIYNAEKASGNEMLRFENPEHGFEVDNGLKKTFLSRLEAGKWLYELDAKGNPMEVHTQTLNEIRNSPPKRSGARAETPAETPSELAGTGTLAGPGGAATPEEFQPVRRFTTSNKNAVMKAERKARGQGDLIEAARQSNQAAWDSAMRKIDENPQVQDELINELNDQPRAVTAEENAMLMHRRIDLRNEYEKSLHRWRESFESGDLERSAEESLRIAGWSDKLSQLEDITKKTGAESGRSLQARKMMANEDYSLAAMEMKAMAAKGRPLTAAEHVELIQAQQRISELENQLLDLESKRETGSIEKDTEATMKEVSSQAPKESKSKDFDIDREENLTSAIKAKIEKGELNDITPLIQQLARVFWRRGIRERGAMIDALHETLKTIVPDFTRDQTQRAFSGYGNFKPLSKGEIDVGLRDLRGQTQQVLKLEALEARKPLEKTGQERRVPSDEERRLIKQVNELKRKYGVVVTDPATQLKSALQSRKTYYEHRISDLKHEIETRQRIVKTKSASPRDAELDAMIAEVERLKAEHEQIFTKPEMTDEQRLKLALAAAERNQAHWEVRLNDAEKGIFSKREPGRKVTSPELEVIQAETAAIREHVKELKDLANPKKTKEEIALQSLKTRMANRTIELKQKLAAGDFSKQKRTPVALDSEGSRIKAELDRAKKEYQRGLIQDRLKNRPWWVKAQDTFLRWYRGGILSSPAVFAKLTAAAIVRAGLTPIEEAVGGVISKALPRLAERAPREGFLNSKAEAKAIMAQLTKGPKDAWDVLKTGESDLDVLYGKGREGAIGESQVRPFSIADIPGRTHAAFKSSTKRAEFERSLEKRLTREIRNGVDASDPAVQLRTSVEAYKDAQRSIFLQDNRVVSAYQRALRALEEPSKVTGKPSLGAKSVATVIRTLVPIVRVPSNIVGEAFQFATGSVTGSARFANAVRKGIDTLPPEEADLIMRELKKGSIGGAAIMVGFLLPQMWGGYYQKGERRNRGDVKASAARIGTKDIPPSLLHHPIFEVIQAGATVRRIADANVKKGSAEKRGLPAGIMAASLGLIEETPFVREMVDTAKAFNPSEQNAYFGELAKSITEPQLIQWIAKQQDLNAEGEVTPRHAKTFGEHLKLGVPGLRKNVPEKKKP